MLGCQAAVCCERIIKQISLTLQVEGVDSGYIDVSELKRALEIAGYKIPQFKVRIMIAEMKPRTSGTVHMLEFEQVGASFLVKENQADNLYQLCAKLQEQQSTKWMKQNIKPAENIITMGGTTEISNDETKHCISVEEQVAFANWINSWVLILLL